MLTVLLQSAVSVQVWLCQVALKGGLGYSHPPSRNQAITCLVVLGAGEKAEPWAREKGLVFSAAHVVCVNARKPCSVGPVCQQGRSWLFSVLGPRGCRVDGRHSFAVVSLAVGL